MSDWKSFGLFSLKIGISAFLVYLVLRTVDIDEMLYILSSIEPTFLIFGILAFILSKWISAFRLNVYFRQTDISLSELFNIKLYILGMFYNTFLPGGISGDAYKLYWLKKNKFGDIPDLFSAIIWDRISGLIALLTIGTSIFIFSSSNQYSGQVFLIEGNSIHEGIQLAATEIIYFFHANSWLIIVLLLSILFIYHAMIKKIQPIYQSILIKTYLHSILVQSFQVVAIGFILLSFGLNWLNPFYYIIFLASSIIAILPISVGGLGLREIVFLIGGLIYGIDPSHTVSVSASFYLITCAVSLMGIYFIIKPLR